MWLAREAIVVDGDIHRHARFVQLAVAPAVFTHRAIQFMLCKIEPREGVDQSFTGLKFLFKAFNYGAAGGIGHAVLDMDT